MLLRYLAEAFRSGIRTAAETMYRTARFRSSPAPLGPATPGARFFSPVQSTPTPFPHSHGLVSCLIVCVRGRRAWSHLICPRGISLSGSALRRPMHGRGGSHSFCLASILIKKTSDRKAQSFVRTMLDREHFCVIEPSLRG